MGTANSYGGSGKTAWRRARQAASNAFGGEGVGGDVAGNPSPQPSPSPADIADIVNLFGDGLYADDPEVRPVRPPSVPLSDVVSPSAGPVGLPPVRRRAGRGAGGGGGGTSAAGGSRARRTRSVSKQARRAGAAIGAGFALEAGDATGLREIGLVLDDLRNLSPIEQTQRIVDHVFGGSADEIEQAAREASARILYEFLSGPPESPGYVRILQAGVAEFIYRRAVIEIAAQMNAGPLTRKEAEDRQRQIRTYIRDLVQGVPEMSGSDGVPGPEVCSRVVAEVTGTTLRALRALAKAST